MARSRELSADELDLIDGVRAPSGLYPAWLKPLDEYMRKLNVKGERLDQEGEDEHEDHKPRRNGARAGDSYMRGRA
jgi:hypothetical protein